MRISSGSGRNSTSATVRIWSKNGITSSLTRMRASSVETSRSIGVPVIALPFAALSSDGCAGPKVSSSCAGTQGVSLETTRSENANIAKRTEAGVNAYWKSRCAKGDPVGCLAPNFQSDRAATNLGARFSRNGLIAAIRTNHIIGHTYNPMAKGEGRYEPIYDEKAVSRDYISIRIDLAIAHRDMVDGDTTGKKGLLSASQVAA